MGEINTTVVAGVLVLVLGQVITRFILDPLQDWRKLRGEISHALHFYANVLVAPGFHTVEQGHEAVTVYRDLASQLWQRSYAIPAPVFWVLSRCRVLPNWDEIRKAASGLTGLSNTVMDSGSHDGRDTHANMVRNALRLHR